MRRMVLIILLISISSQMLCASTLPKTIVYDPYELSEFPVWSQKLRRGETLLFGSFPITLTLTSLSYSLATSLGAPAFATEKETIAMFSIAAGLSLIIAVTDFIIGELER
ncbi:MAG: hypothetical protein AB9828_10335 [Sphaerochaetaceae bacterium]